jgi:hypothetical protein
VQPDAKRELFVMMRTKVLVGTLITAFALAASTSMVDAKTKTKHEAKAKPAATAVDFSSSPPASLKCKKGETYVLHTMGKMKWGCAKV